MSGCVAVLFVLGSTVSTGPSACGTADRVAAPLDSAAESAAPRAIPSSQSPPVYPPAALAGRFDGAVDLRVAVREDGTVGDVDVLWCDHEHLGFEEASLAAVREWRFHPARRAGAAVEANTTLRVTFRPGGMESGRGVYVTGGSDAATTAVALASTSVARR